MQNFLDAALHSSMQFWSMSGPNRLVKVMGPDAERYMLQTGRIRGYVTQEKYLYGMAAHQIERALGLRPRELSQLCRIYSLARLPTAREVEFKFSAAFPDGRPAGDQQHMQIMQAREDFAAGKNLYQRSQVPTVQAYLPGSAMVPQWKLIMEIQAGGLIASVTDQFAFPRDSGSIKPYTPHNRGPIR